tara:strand:+ start:9 stop:953 length:945 start_codon:yes stop_codon:yes gene_type:complete
MANLSGNNLMLANLSSATLTGANIEGANFKNSILTGVKSGGIIGEPVPDSLPSEWVLLNGKLIYTKVGATGDPYITPVYGPSYKLPDRNGVYRYISNKTSSFADRFSIDADVVALTRKQQAETLRFIVEQAKHRMLDFDPSNRITLDGYFFRNYMITNHGEKLLIDMEANTINNEPIQNMVTKYFKVTVGKDDAPLTYPYNKEKNEPTYSLTIETFHNTYGNIKVTLNKYVNPQIRNGIHMQTENKLTHENSKGFIMHFQDYKQFSIHKLGSKKDIADFDKTKVPGLENKVTEEFNYGSSGVKSLVFYQQPVRR